MKPEDQFNPRSRRLPIRISITQSTIETFLDSEIMNLSKGGVFIRSDITLPLGSEVDFQFTLPRSNRLIRVTGIVVWARNAKKGERVFFPGHAPGMGIQFKRIEPEDIDSILDEIEHLMQNDE